jgi:hypothetical protein
LILGGFRYELFWRKGMPAEYKAGLDLAIEKGWCCARAARLCALPVCLIKKGRLSAAPAGEIFSG